MENKKEFLWRENDQSPRTNLKFELEASHWLSAIKNSTPSPTPTFSQVSGFIGLLLSFTFNILHFVILSIIELVKWIRKVWPKAKDKYDGVPTFDNRPQMTDEEMNDMLRISREHRAKEKI